MLPLHHDPGTDPKPAFQSLCRHFRISFANVEWPEVESNHRCRRIRATCFRYNTGPVIASAFVSLALVTFVPIGKVGIEPTVSCSQGTRVTITLHPGKVLISSSGNRTPLSALKGQHPGPVDERAVRACAQVGRVVLESTSPGLQPGATPSQLPTPLPP